jgi:hypothetical protein
MIRADGTPARTEAGRSAGLRGHAWDYAEPAYYEQPPTIDGAPAENSPYVTRAHLQDLARQVPGLDLSRWQAGAAKPSPAAAVADASAAHTAGVDGTPTEVVGGPHGSVQYDTAGTLPAVPTPGQPATLITQVG